MARVMTIDTAKTKAIYDSVAQSYDSRYKKTRHFVEEELIADEAGWLSPFMKVLSLGCGTGEDITVLQIPPEEFLGVDISYPMIKRAITKYPDYRFEVWDATTPVPGRYHTVVGIFGFINYAGLHTFINNLRSVHAEQFIAVCYSDWYTPDYSKDVCTNYSLSDIQEAIELAGFDVSVSGLSFPVPNEDKMSFEELYTQQSLLSEMGVTDGCRYWVVTGSRK